MNNSLEIESDVTKTAEAGPPVIKWMSADPQRVAPQTALTEVARLMSSQRHSCVIVCDDNNVAGLISERDLVRVLPQLIAGENLNFVAADIMSTPVISIGLNDTIDSATKLMSAKRIRRLVVLDDNDALAGIVTQSDIMRAHVRQIESHQITLEARVSERTAELETANEQLETLSRIDPLMNIGNRRAMEEALSIAHQRSSRYQRTYSVILLDVDQFKNYNDTYGHPRGDRILRDIAREMLGCVRILDTVYRYGGEEVLVLLPETAAQGAVAVAERIRRSVAALANEHRSSKHGVVTISAGIATSVPRPDGTIPGVLELLDAADKSLYEAKDAGRNRLGSVVEPA